MLRRRSIGGWLRGRDNAAASRESDHAVVALLLRRRFAFVLTGGLVFLSLSILLSLMFGAFGPLDPLPGVVTEGRGLSFSGFFEFLSGGGSETHRSAIIEIRLPRILLAGLVGTALALSGATMQGVFRNPLAEPFILGVSSGAALGAALNLVVGIGGDARFIFLPVLAFGGGLLATFATYGVARASGRPGSETLLLAGVALNSLFTAVLLGFLFFSGEQFRSLFFWILGGFDRATWPAVLVVALAAGAGSVFLMHRAKSINLLMLGDDQAASLGVDVEREKRDLLIVSTMLAAVSVAFAGAIGFVGLIIPHLLRILIGSDNRLLVPAAALFGGAFLVWADLGARTVLDIGELPVGIITALCGAPFFLFLLARRRSVLGRF